MARPVTERIQNIRNELELRLRNDPMRPGERFFSNRSVSQKYGISYQTAHRLLRALEDQGLLRRDRSSGTYVAGGITLRRVELCFHTRAREPDSFGARLLALVNGALQTTGLAARTTWIKGPHAVPADVYPILWEAGGPEGVRFEGAHHFGLILNDRPPPGLRSSFLDSLSTDDYSGGAAAAELLLDRGLKPRHLAVLGGPRGDGRSDARIRGFLSVVRKVSVTHASTWFYEDGLRAAPRVLRESPRGVFCMNDRLAAALQDFTAARSEGHKPRIVGYDDAPIALARRLTTIAIPWEEIAQGAAMLALARIRGDTSPARAQIFSPRPLIRWEEGIP
jgi:hypothetical protein